MCRFDETVDALAALLNLCTFLQMSRLRNYALQQLNALPSWCPFLKLYLGLRHEIADWAQTSFRHIVIDIPLDKITMDNMLCIGGPTFWAIAQAKNKILEHRRLQAFDWPEAVHGPNCTLSVACRLTWKSEWWYTFAKCILHPEKRYTPTQALEQVELTYTEFMSEECKALTIQTIREDEGLDPSDEIIQEALNTLIQFVRR